jgi:hypothetical protein
MTKTQAQIIELFHTLPVAARRKLATELYEQTERGSFCDRMSQSQWRELEQAIAEADRGEGATAGDVFEKLAKKRGFARASAS